MKEIISVIVPVYNVEKYLDRCVQSILNQTYPYFELILVDDGSPDNCGKMCDEYAKKDDRVIVIHQENKGLSGARNIGIEKSRGKFLTFIDSDDWISKTYLEEMCNEQKRTKADVVVCNIDCVTLYDGNYKSLNYESPIVNEIIDSKKMLEKLLENNNWYYVVAWNKLYKKSLFKKCKYPLDRFHEDEFIIHHIVNECNRIACLKNKLYFYFQRSDSIIHDKAIEKKKDVDKFFAYYDRTLFFKNKNLVNLYNMTLDICFSCYTNILFKYDDVKLQRNINMNIKSLRKDIIFNTKNNLKNKIRKAILIFFPKMGYYLFLKH